MSYLLPNYARKAIEFSEGKNQTLIDCEGNQYLDFTSGIGVMNLGYGNDKLNEQLAEQAAKIWHTPNLYENHLQEEVAEALAKGKNYLSFFCNSGAEANEAAIKLARKASGKTKIITFTHSFHGRTYGAMSATGQVTIQAGFEPIVPEFVYVPYNEIVPLKQAVDQKTAAVMLEVIQGEGGVIPANETWLQEVVSYCHLHDVLVIVDEVQTGIGRTGSFYAFEQYGIEPDIVTLAKGLGNGIPVGAMLAKECLSEAFSPGSHGSTFGGNNLAMRAANYVVGEVNQADFLQEVQQKGGYLLTELEKLQAHSSIILEVRGRGLMIGIELTDTALVAPIIAQLQAKGLLVLRAGNKVIRLLPPLTVTMAELKKGMVQLEAVLKKESSYD